MIAFFPKAYPDELLYSILSRYHQRTGNARFVFTAEELYKNGKLTHPSVDFVNAFTDDAMMWITKEKEWKEIAEKHTMYPACIRFLPLKRRKEAEEGVRKQNGNWKNLMCIPKLEETRYLRFCPICAKEDREKYGETYWHRVHQIPRVNVCSKHKVYLEHSSIIISSKASPGLYDAQSCIPETPTARQCENEREIFFTKYVEAVFNSPIDFETDFYVGNYLQARISKNYKNKSGLMCSVSKFYDDYTAFFDGLPKMPKSYMQKIFNGYIFDTYFVLQLAFFEGISVFEITHIPLQESTNELDVLYSHLSEKYNIDYSLVTKIASEILSYTQHKISETSGPKKSEYERLDAELLPKVKSFVEGITSKQGRPERISVTKIQRLMSLPQKCFNKLPECKAYIEAHSESQNQFRARSVEWAAKEIEKSNGSISLSKIMKMINIRKKDILSCCDEIKDDRVKNIIKEYL